MKIPFDRDLSRESLALALPVVAGMLSQTVQKGPSAAKENLQCPKCHNDVHADSRFCQNCGAQLVILNRCPDCQTELPAEAQFCSNCGRKLGMTLTCPHCGTKLPPGTKFCTNCGEKVEKEDNAG